MNALTAAEIPIANHPSTCAQPPVGGDDRADAQQSRVEAREVVRLTVAHDVCDAEQTIGDGEEPEGMQ